MAARLEMVVSSRARNSWAKRYKEFFLNLEAALAEQDHDHARSFQFLKHARSIAEELMSKFKNVDGSTV